MKFQTLFTLKAACPKPGHPVSLGDITPVATGHAFVTVLELQGMSPAWSRADEMQKFLVTNEPVRSHHFILMPDNYAAYGGYDPKCESGTWVWKTLNSGTCRCRVLPPPARKPKRVTTGGRTGSSPALRPAQIG